ncbi:uncharacterized protein [Palaemon carinicauda]|uniref:uncharacterized protein n=1 Tax=Palaemon carinicauda TaxID=392227 RepID=UPI0035B6236A
MRTTPPIWLTTVTILLVYCTKETSGNLEVATDNDGLIVIASYQALAIIGILKLLIGILFLVDSEMHFFRRKKRDLLRGKEERPSWLTGLLGCGLRLACDFQRLGYDVVSEDELIRSIFGRSEMTPFQPRSDRPDPGHVNDLARPGSRDIKRCRGLFPRCPSLLRKVVEL